MEAVKPKAKKKSAGGRARQREVSKKKNLERVTPETFSHTSPSQDGAALMDTEEPISVPDSPKVEVEDATGRGGQEASQAAQGNAELQTSSGKEGVASAQPPTCDTGPDLMLFNSIPASAKETDSGSKNGNEILTGVAGPLLAPQGEGEGTISEVAVHAPTSSSASLPSAPAVEESVQGTSEQSIVGVVMSADQPKTIESPTMFEHQEVVGQSADVAGQSAEVEGQSAEVAGQSAEVTTSLVPSAPALIDLDADIGVERQYQVIYPTLPEGVLEEGELPDQLTPYTAEDLALLYPNPQLDANHVFVENFVRNVRCESHELYQLLMTYLKTKLALTNTRNQIQDLRAQYETHEKLVWQFETKEITATGKCGCGSKVSHNYSHRVAEFDAKEAGVVTGVLKSTRNLLEEELCVRSYSCQLARVHVEHYLYRLMQSVPNLEETPSHAPVTNWVPQCPPGALEPYCSALRDSVSVLFTFERRPVRDKTFSKDCRKWLTQLVSVLLRVSSLTDHQFLFNHLLRCPAGVGEWASPFLQVPSPLRTRELLQMQYHDQQRGNGVHSGYSHHWGVGLGLHGDWGGPVLDHFMAMLATLVLPVRERDAFLALLRRSPKLSRELSATPWTFIDDMEDVKNGESESPLLLEESDYSAFFEQFHFNDLFRYILQFEAGGDTKMEGVASHQMLRLLAFSTCLVRLLGTAFTTLRLAQYKEFIKHIGQTIRNTVSFVADYWVAYRSFRLQCGDTMATIPEDTTGSDPRHSLNRLQLEFDQFVLGAVRWILTADKLGVWQFLADMPYGSVSLNTIWKVFWNIYCKHSSCGQPGPFHTGEGAPVLLSPDASPCSVAEIQEAIKAGTHKDGFVDRLMKTYTSEAVYLLTTLVNMARARSCDSRDRSCDSEGEKEFIDVIVLEIFECTHVIEYARETYSKTGAHLLGSVAIVHPFIISTLLERAETAVGAAGENVILLFKELPLHLWVPRSCDIQLIRSWLLDYQLPTSESSLARVILTGLNWGTRTHDGSNSLVLPWSLHCSTSLMLMEAQCRHLPSRPGGRGYDPSSSTTLVGKLAAQFATSSSQVEFVKWTWEVVLMLKLHVHQVTSHSMQTLCPSSSGGVARPVGSGSAGDLSPPPWIQVDPQTHKVTMPDLASSSSGDLAELRDAIKNEGLLAYYIGLCVTDLGQDSDKFMSAGVPMLTKLLEEGYHLAVLRVLGNVLPGLLTHTKCLLQDSGFIQLILSLARADADNSSYKERWVTGTAAPVVTKKLSALIQTQLVQVAGPMNSGGSESVLRFWLQLVLGCPNWHRERSLMLLLDTLCMAAFSKPTWTEVVQEMLLEAYQALIAAQPKKGLLSSVYSSVTSIVWQDVNSASLFNVIPHEECPWLAFNALSAEQRFEDKEKIWRTLLARLKRDQKASVDSALKKSFSELKHSGAFGASHLCIYRWAGFCSSLSHTHPLYPLLWQRFFNLYLARPSSTAESADKQSFGPRFFSSSNSISQLRTMKTSLSGCCKRLQANIAALEQPDWATAVGVSDTSDQRRDTLRSFWPKCLKFYQTLRLWLEEPRLHGPTLYLPGLPPQYDSNRLSLIFQGNKAPWLEFVPRWEVKAELNSLVGMWAELAAYQKPLRCEPHPPQNGQDNALDRIEKRLQKSSTSVSPPPFIFCHAPFSPLPPQLLLSKESLINLVCEDMNYFVAQAKSFTSHLSTLTLLDEECVSGVPELYTNDPRQFHVRVPCRSRFNRSHECPLPATIVFRFNEMVTNQKWDVQLRGNREDYKANLTALCTPVTSDLVGKVMRMEHVVAELSRMASSTEVSSSENTALQNGVSLFYEILPFVRTETRQYPPTNQFLTSCMQILGQAFIQQDPLQTSNVLQLLLTEYDKSDILAPLFHPNLCPQQFVEMYGSSVGLSAKEGPVVAFSVLTKFNTTIWLQTYSPGMAECEQLLHHVCVGLNLCGPRPTGNHEILMEVYRRHYIHLVGYQFPLLYLSALRHLINGTEKGSICMTTWMDLRQAITCPDTPSACTLGLQQVHDSLDLLHKTFSSRRLAAKITSYSMVSHDYVPLIGLFLRQLCYGMVSRWAEDVAMETAKHSQALNVCWQYTINGFEPWIGVLFHDSTNDMLFPCGETECGFMQEMTQHFVECLTFMDSKLEDPSLSLLWAHYTSAMALPSTPHYILTIYHAALETLPWRTFHPELVAMDAMMKLKMDDSVPGQSFVFLGRIFPLFDWEEIVAAYCSSGDPSSVLQFHIMFLQLLVMLTSEREVMEKDDTGIPSLILLAQKFHWHLLDSRVYQDVLTWLKSHCDSSSILHKGSQLSLSLRLLRAAAGFPTSSGARQQLNEETWEKRYSLLQLMVELVANATNRMDSQGHSYADCVANLFQIAVDVCVHEPEERNSPHLILLMQEILNLLNQCSTQSDMGKKLLDIMLDVIEQLPQAHLLVLSTITAACQSLVSFDFMVKIIEHAMENHFSTQATPPPHPLQLQSNPVTGYGWRDVTDSLVVPDDVISSVVESSISHCTVLVLHSLILKELVQCSSLAAERKVLGKILQWCTSMKPKPAHEAKLLLIWGKALDLVIRQVQFQGNLSDLLPHLNTISSLLLRFGEDKASEGLLGVLGLGKKSQYSHRFRLIARSLGVFLLCQMPVDSSGQVRLRTFPNSAGHIRDAVKQAASSATPTLAILPTKQSEQASQNLESLLGNSKYAHLSEQVTYAVEFLAGPDRCVTNSMQLLVWLSACLYPEHRYIDILRVAHQ